jgi:hypothetical protein
MNQRELNRAVAHVTGETVTAIGGMGFSLVEMPHVDDFHDAIDLEDKIVNWDELENQQRCGLLAAA